MLADLVVNLTARGHARAPELTASMRQIAAGRCRVHLCESLVALDDACDRIAADGSPLVILSGGDGTLMAGVSALHERLGTKLPRIAALRAGTAGTIAKNWGMDGEPASRLSALLDGPRRLQPQPSLMVEAQHSGGEDKRVGFIFGTGLVASFFRLYEARGAPGYAGAAQMVARIFAESFVGGPMAREVLTPMPCRLVVDGRNQPQRAWSLICASVVRDLGIGMRLTYRAADDPLRPHLVASALPPRRLGPRAPRVLAGRSIGGPDLVDGLVEQLEVRFEEHGRYVLDGELLTADRVLVRAGPVLDTVI